MWDWITFFLVLILALAISYLTASIAGFTDYVFVPWGWRRRWGPGWGWGPGWRASWRPWWRRRWVPRYVTYVEPFENQTDSKDKKESFENQQISEQKILDSQGKKNFERRNEKDLTDIGYPNLYNDKPYHLLSDEFNSLSPEKISCVNSRSCYATSFDRFLEQTGNFRQITNNYKRGYPDSCSSPFQELVLSFYKTQPLDMKRPTNCL